MDLRVPVQNVKHDFAASEEMQVGRKATWERERKEKNEKHEGVWHLVVVLMSWQWPLCGSLCVSASHTMPVHWQLRQHIWLPITTREHSSLGPRVREKLEEKYGKT